MPDIDFQRIELNLIPKKGDDPVVFYASQYETARPFIADLKWGDTEFAPGDDCWAEIDIRKNDDNLVVITDDVTIDNNEVSVILPVQAVTCIGKNLGQVKIYAADDQLIAALNFILEVQADPLAGGVTSETAIDNLTQQIEDIAQEVIGDDYYNKTEVDTLLADKADVSDLPDMSLYYTKTATDTLLNAKADKSDTYTKAQVDTALAAKANTADLATVATTGDYDDLINKPVLPDMTQYYTKSEVDTLLDNQFPTFTASGVIATFTTALNKPLVSVTADPSATEITRCGKNLIDQPTYTVNVQSKVVDFGRNITVDNLTLSFTADNAIASATNAAIVDFRQSDDTHNYKTLSVFYNENNVPFVIPNNPYSGRFSLSVSNITFSALYIYYMSSSYSAIQSDSLSDFQLEIGLSNTAFETYNGITVPIADATTINTLSGVNNVFADTGSVTVQYKYMSM